MTKSDLINKIYNSKSLPAGVTKRAVVAIVDATFAEIGTAIKKDSRFLVPQFGTFEKRHRKSRKGRNPQTGKTMTIPATVTVGFRPAIALKSSVGGKKR